LGLIRLEVTVEEGNTDATAPILASPPKGNKPKLLDQAQAVMRRKHYLMEAKAWRVSPPGDCASLSPAQTPSFLLRSVIIAMAANTAAMWVRLHTQRIPMCVN
jgi:hypothetical protein